LFSFSKSAANGNDSHRENGRRSSRSRHRSSSRSKSRKKSSKSTRSPKRRSRLGYFLVYNQAFGKKSVIELCLLVFESM
jgi:hypothetical protein